MYINQCITRQFVKFWVRVWLVLFIVSALGLTACKKKEPIKIGLAGCLTGHLSDLGVAIRNAVILATDEINAKGGVNGRTIKLIIRDDGNNPVLAAEAAMDLVNIGVTAIIGHSTSAMSLAALPVIDQFQIPLISPTSTSNRLTGRDDYFFRITSPDKIQSDIIARYAWQELGIRSIVCIYDLSNLAFTEDWFYNFKHQFEALGGKITGQATFESDQEFSYRSVLNTAQIETAESILIIAGAINTAMFAQQIRKSGSDIQILTSGWAGVLQLIQYGGTAVEGIIFPQVFNEESDMPEYLHFKNQYQTRFGKSPNFAAVCGYEAAQYLFAALSYPAGKDSLKTALLNQGEFKGLQGLIKVDPYGDAERSQFIVTVADGKLKTISTLYHQ